MRGLALLLGVCGVVAALLAFKLVVPMIPANASASSMAIRLGLASAALLPGVAVLAAMQLVQMAGRYGTMAFDPLAASETRFLRVNQRIITNTVEQLAVFAPSLLALAAGAPAARMPEVVALGAVFALGRVLFWGGYLCSPDLRGPGMAATLVATLGALAAAAWFWMHG